MDAGNVACEANYLSRFTPEQQALIREQLTKEHPDRSLWAIRGEGPYLYELLGKAQKARRAEIGETPQMPFGL